MKTLFRIAVIVAASLLVIGAAFAYVQSGGNALTEGGPGLGGFIEGGTRPQRGQGDTFVPPGDGQNFTPPEGGAFNGETGEGFRREGGREAGGLGGLVEVFKNVVVMGVIALVVIVISVAWRRVSGLWRRPTPPAAPTAPPSA